jgi:hypothetical protein
MFSYVKFGGIYNSNNQQERHLTEQFKTVTQDFPLLSHVSEIMLLCYLLPTDKRQRKYCMPKNVYI